MSSSRKLIEASLKGNSAKHIVDCLVEELPPLPALYSSIRRELPSKSVVKIEDNVVFIEYKDKFEISESLHYLGLVYPELEFVVK